MGAATNMSRLTFGRLTEAWTGEATDFTPLLAEQLDTLGAAIGVDLASIGRSEVPSAGGRRIDIVAQGEDGSEFVIENQYGRADHDHLTRGLAYAVASHARGLVVVAEEHRDEFRAVAQYLNDLAEHDPERSVAVWLVEARAVRIDDSRWAPLFTPVIQPNQFTTNVERARAEQSSALSSMDEFYAQFNDTAALTATENIVNQWVGAGRRRRLGPNHVVLEARGPSVGGYRTVVALFNNGQVLIPFSSYAGTNSGIAVPALTSPEFRPKADTLFGLRGTEKQARTAAGWLTAEKVEPLLEFCQAVSSAYLAALSEPYDASGRPQPGITA